MNEKYKTCGECKYFVKDKTGACGKCAKREYLYQKFGAKSRTRFQDRKFIPYRRRKACVNDFEPLKEGELK